MSVFNVAFLGLGIGFISCLCSCVGAVHNGIDICDKKSGKIVGTVESAEYREMVCRDVRLRHRFFTLTQENRSLVFKERDQNGKVEKKYRLPLLNSVWVDSYWFSVSPKCDMLVYWKDASWVKKNEKWVELPAELRVRSFKDNSETVIFKEPTIEGISHDFLAWSSSDSVIYVRRAYDTQKPNTSIFKIHTSGNLQKIEIPYCRGIRMDSTGRYLAGVQDESFKQEPDWKKGDSVVILDLQKMKIVKTVNTGIKNASIHAVAWNEKGHKVAFNVGARGHKLNMRYFAYNLDTHNLDQDEKAINLDRVNGDLFDYLGLVWISGSGRYVKER